MNKQDIIKALEETKSRSAWDKGVNSYAIDLVDECEVAELTIENVKETLLNGADDWEQYSYGGCSLIYDADIAEALCNPSELKRTDSGRLHPNSRETWLDCQARALRQAFGRINGIIKRYERREAYKAA